jgi:eukaryotic translation initiation factor 2C
LNSGPTIKALNILISKAICGDSPILTEYQTGDVAQVSAKKFFLGAESVDLTISLCAIRSFYYTAKPGADRVLLNVNSGMSAFFQNITVAKFLEDTSTFTGTTREQRQDMLVGRQVLITYNRGRTAAVRLADGQNLDRRVKTIFRFGRGTIDGTNITIDEEVDGEEVQNNYSVKDYLRKRKSFPLSLRGGILTLTDYPELTFAPNSTLKAVNLGNKANPSWFAPEHLRIMPYQVYRRPVPDHLTSDMLAIANNTPEVNQRLMNMHGLTTFKLRDTNEKGWKTFVRH